ncbi:MAG: response regulator, partial [Bacteroidia bacterium]|nr:response regulator [Bacteroidia bacterium]
SNTTNTTAQVIYEDQQNKLWIGYHNRGLTHYDPDSKLTVNYEPNINDPESLPEKSVWSLTQSRDGTLWGATTGAESTVFKIKKRNFSNYKLSSNTNFVGSFCESVDNKLWIGTNDNDLYQLDLKSNTKQFFKPKSIEIAATNINTTNVDKSLLAKDQILKFISKIVVDSSGGLWMTKELLPGLIYFNPSNGNLKIYMHDPENEHSIGEGFVSDILRDDQGQIWIVTANGDLNLYDPSQDRFKRYKYSSLSDNEFGTGYDCLLNQSKDGRIWIVGTGPNLNKNQVPPVIGYFDQNESKFQSLNIDLTSKELHLVDRQVRNIEEDANGNIWICNPTHLIEVVKSNGLVKIHQTNQFESEELKCMIMDNQGLLWIIGEKISFFDPLIGISNVKTIAINTIRNMPDYKQTVFKDANGLIYIGGEKEFQYFDPEQIVSLKRNKSPETIISNFELLNVSGDKKNDLKVNVLDNSKLQLEHNQNTFTLSFATLDFQEPEKNRIQFKLDGFDEQWRTSGSEPLVTYIKVPPGEYTFKVKGATLTSDWGDVKQLGIIITPPIWGTWWAYLLYLLLGLSLFYSFYRFQLNRKLEKAEALRLKDLDSAKNRLFTNITHEFRTPLTVISGMSEQIKENPDKWLNKGLNVINRNSTRLNNLVNQMLDLSKLESGKLKLNPVQSDIIPFVKYLCESFNSSSEASQLKLMVYAEVEELIMDFDSSKLSTVIINLLSNAIKFTSPGGKIIVHLNSKIQKGKSYFLIKVKDTGSGISQDDLENIFNRFYQVDSSSTRAIEGTGIGLALTKELVELMEGTIMVKSKLGKGSEFIVQLPVTKKAAITHDVSLPFKPKSLELNETITTLDEETDENSDLPIALIIEDNEDVAQYLKICLEERHHVLYAKDGIKGLEMAYEHIPDIVISDVMMPGKDGLEVCSILKKDERTDHIPVILLTAKSSLQDRISGLSHGADAYLTKPFSKVELFTRLD